MRHVVSQERNSIVNIIYAREDDFDRLCAEALLLCASTEIPERPAMTPVTSQVHKRRMNSRLQIRIMIARLNAEFTE